MHFLVVLIVYRPGLGEQFIRYRFMYQGKVRICIILNNTSLVECECRKTYNYVYIQFNSCKIIISYAEVYEAMQM